MAKQVDPVKLAVAVRRGEVRLGAVPEAARAAVQKALRDERSLIGAARADAPRPRVRHQGMPLRRARSA